MVKYIGSHSPELDEIFHALSDPTRRDILDRLLKRPLTVSEIKRPYKFSLVAVSKHLKVLERAKLVRRQKLGREYLIRLHARPLKDANRFVELFKKEWTRQLDALEKFVERNS